VSVSMDLPGAQGFVRERLRSTLEKARQQGVERAELAAALPFDLPEGDLDRALKDLVREGIAVERRGRWLAVEHSPLATGIVEILPDDDAVVRPPRGAHGGRPGASWYVAGSRLRGALDGDRVLVQERGRRHKDLPGRRLPEANVVAILERRNDTVVGSVELDRDDRKYLVPYDPKNKLDIELVNPLDAEVGDWAVVRLTSGAGAFAEGEIVQVLGPSTEPGVDTEVVLHHYRIPQEFPADVLAALEALPAEPREEDWRGREDLREVEVVTIDGPTARDFDDAVAVEKLGGGRYRLSVHIADVAQYVPEGSPLDLEAYRRGTSVYFPERAVPMLPEKLSNGLCSLRPDVPRLALSVFLDVDGEGHVVRRRFAETVIRSHRRMTYDEVRRILEEPEPRDAREYGSLVEHLRTMRELAALLLARREERGSIDFDLPEGDVILDTDGVVVGIKPTERNVAHRIIEDFMIAANEAVAEELETKSQPALYRVHDVPEADDLEELREVLSNLGLKLKGDVNDLPPAELRRVLQAVAGRPEEEFVHTLVLRTMKQARYADECRGHYALASRYYTHFTSPIRRYPDLVIHRRLKAMLRRSPKEAREAAAETLLPERLPAIGTHTSTLERRAEQAERDVLQWKKIRYMAEHVGERFAGRITGVQPFGLFVRLEPHLVDGLVPIRSMHDDFYVFEAQHHRLVGDKRGRVFKLGDAVEVILEKVDYLHRGLDLAIADLKSGGGWRRGGRR
jgi:ribonuclease R